MAMKLKTLVLIGLLGGAIVPCVAIEQGGECTEAVNCKAMYLNDDRVNGYEKNIRSELERNNNLRFMAKGVGCIAGLTACLMLYNDFRLVPGEELHSLRQDYSRLASFAKVIAATDPFKNNEELQNIQSSGGDLQAGSGWGATIGRMLGQMALTSFVGYVSQKIMAGVFFEQSVKWFVQERTLLPDVERQLQDLKLDVNTVKLGRARVAQEDCDRYVETMMGMHNEIAEQLEHIVAYMGYRVSTFPQTTIGALSAKATTGGYLKSRIKSVADQLNASFEQYKKCVKKDERVLIIITMLDDIQLLMSQIVHNVSQFALVEKKMQRAA